MIDVGIVLDRCKNCGKVYGCDITRQTVILDMKNRLILRGEKREHRKCKKGSLECRFIGICNLVKYGIEVAIGVCEECARDGCVWSKNRYVKDGDPWP